MTQELQQDFDQVYAELNSALTSEKLDDEVIVCECFCVNALDIRNTCSDSGVVDLVLLKSTFGLGDGCKTCLKHQEYWINKIY
jgi:hypothetical protein